MNKWVPLCSVKLIPKIDDRPDVLTPEYWWVTSESQDQLLICPRAIWLLSQFWCAQDSMQGTFDFSGWYRVKKGASDSSIKLLLPAVSRVVTPSVSSKLWSLRMREPSPQLTNNLKPGVGAHLVYFLVPWGQNFQQKKLVKQKKSGKMCFKRRYICLLMKTLKCSL